MSIAAGWGCATIFLAIATASGFGVWYFDVRIPADQSWVLLVLGISTGLFSILALAAAVIAARAMLAARTAESVIELDSIDLHPGSRTSLYVRQDGPVELNQIQVILRCRDIETITTEWEELDDDDRVRRRSEYHSFETPLERTILERVELSIKARTPFEITTELTIPDNALPSGVTKRRERLTADSMPSNVPSDARRIRRTIQTEGSWSIVVTGDAKGRVDFEHEFPIVVYGS